MSALSRPLVLAAVLLVAAGAFGVMKLVGTTQDAAPTPPGAAAPSAPPATAPAVPLKAPTVTCDDAKRLVEAEKKIDPASPHLPLLEVQQRTACETGGLVVPNLLLPGAPQAPAPGTLPTKKP